jgi:hypothetical protein
MLRSTWNSKKLTRCALHNIKSKEKRKKPKKKEKRKPYKSGVKKGLQGFFKKNLTHRA